MLHAWKLRGPALRAPAPRGREPWPRIRRVKPVPAAAALAAVVLCAAAAGTWLGGSAQAAATLCGFHTAQVSGGTYIVQNDEYASAATECLGVPRGGGFTVARSSISQSLRGTPGGYPSIYAGCHWGYCTSGGLGAKPIRVGDLVPGALTSSWSTVQPRTSTAAYDAAYDIWINRTPTTSGAPDGSEIMVWLRSHGGVRPEGKEVARNIWIGSISYDVWDHAMPGGANTVTYVMNWPKRSVRDLDIGALAQYAVRHGYTNPRWYLISVEAGFELWKGGAGLATTHFSVNIASSLRPAPPLVRMAD